MANDPAFRAWWATYLRMGASPGAALALTRMNAEIDIRDILPSIRVPTLVLHRRHDHLLNVEEGRYVASRIPGARFVELPGEDHLPFVGDQDAIIDEIERFVTGAPSCGHQAAARPRARDDPARARRRRRRRPPSSITPRRECEWFRGRPLPSTEGQFVAAFDGPARAIRCASALTEAGSRFAVQVRVGLHTGECTIDEGMASGPPLDLASGIAYRAAAGEALVSRTVRDIVGDAGLPFEDRGRAPDSGDGGVAAVQRVTQPSSAAPGRRMTLQPFSLEPPPCNGLFWGWHLHKRAWNPAMRIVPSIAALLLFAVPLVGAADRASETTEEGRHRPRQGLPPRQRGGAGRIADRGRRGRQQSPRLRFRR